MSISVSFLIVSLHIFCRQSFQNSPVDSEIVPALALGVSWVGKSSAVAKRYGLLPNYWVENTIAMIWAKILPEDVSSLFFKDRISKSTGLLLHLGLLPRSFLRLVAETFGHFHPR